MSFVYVPVAFAVGALSASNPCVLPLFPAYLAYLGKSKASGDWGGQLLVGLLIVAGVLTSMLLLGLAASLTFTAIFNLLSVFIPIADGLLIALGVILILNVKFRPLFPSFNPRITGSRLNPYLYGMVFGPIALPCNAPLLISVFALSASLTDFAARFLTFVVFGLGFSTPLFAMSLLSASRRGWLVRQLNGRQRQMNLVAGTILIGIAVFNLFYSATFLSIAYFS